MTSFDAFDHFPYRIYIRDSDMRIIYINDIAVEYMMFNRKETVGKKCDEVFVDFGYLKHIEKMQKYFFMQKHKKFSTFKELNKCLNKPQMLQIIEYVEEYMGNPIIVSILISVDDENYPNQSLPLGDIGEYKSATRKVVFKDGSISSLTSLENSLLFAINKPNGEIVSYEDIFLSIDPYNKMNRVSLKSLVYRLNKKIKNIIKNESGKGYRISNT